MYNLPYELFFNKKKTRQSYILIKVTTGQKMKSPWIHPLQKQQDHFSRSFMRHEGWNWKRISRLQFSGTSIHVVVLAWIWNPSPVRCRKKASTSYPHSNAFHSPTLYFPRWRWNLFFLWYTRTAPPLPYRSISRENHLSHKFNHKALADVIFAQEYCI